MEYKGKKIGSAGIQPPNRQGELIKPTFEIKNAKTIKTKKLLNKKRKDSSTKIVLGGELFKKLGIKP